MHVEVATDHEQMSRRAAACIAAAIRRKPDLLLGVVTGGTGARCPASFLWRHPDVTVCCDREAGRALEGVRP